MFNVLNLAFAFLLGKKANLGKNASVNAHHGPALEAVETTVPKQGQNLW